MKKCLTLLFILIFLLSGCQKKEPTYKKEINIEGSIFTGTKDSVVSTELVFDDAWITSEDNTVFNTDLAKVAAILSTDSYFREKDLEKGSQNRVLLVDSEEDYDYSLLFKALGFDDVEHIESFKQKYYEYDTNDSVTMNLGYKNVDDKYDTFIVVIRGCFSAGEWTTIYDSGANDSSYGDATGNHPEWNSKDIHKGIDVAVNRAKEFIDEFVNSHDTDRPNTMLLTGHSRGGTIANILGSELEESDYAKMYTYTFNAMKATMNSSDSKTVFNIFDSNDFFTDLLPFKNEKFERNGTDICEDIAGNDEIKSIINKIKKVDNYDCVSKEFLDNYRIMFEDMFIDRNSLYELKTIEKEFDEKSLAQEKYDELLSLTDGSHLGLDGIMSISNIEEVDGKYCFKIEYNNATVLRGLSKIFTYGEAANDGLQTLFEEDNKACELYTLVTNNISKLNGAHYIINDYAIIENYHKS